MSTLPKHLFWLLSSPTRGGSLPSALSHSSARLIEDCPRRWWLERGDYAGFGLGYPRRVTFAAVRGDILHRAAELFIRSARRDNVDLQPLYNRAPYYEELGGSEWLRTISADVSEMLLLSPRIPKFAKDKLRFAIDRGLQGLEDDFGNWIRDLKSPDRTNPLQANGHREELDAPNPRAKAFALTAGQYVEQRLEAAGWTGKVDLINVSQRGAHIIDFKSGSESDDHKDQLVLYASLWLLDRQRNPSQLPVTDLTLQYVNKRVSVQVPDATAESVRRALAGRRKQLAEMLSVDPPRANVGEGCRHCSVRHMCEPYWRDFVDAPFQDAAFSHYGDVEVQLSGHNNGYWSANLVMKERPRSQVELGAMPVNILELTSGDRLRILDAERIDSSGRFIIRLTDRSEVHVIPAPIASSIFPQRTDLGKSGRA